MRIRLIGKNRLWWINIYKQFEIDWYIGKDWDSYHLCKMNMNRLNIYGERERERERGGRKRGGGDWDKSTLTQATLRYTEAKNRITTYFLFSQSKEIDQSNTSALKLMTNINRLWKNEWSLSIFVFQFFGKKFFVIKDIYNYCCVF